MYLILCDYLIIYNDLYYDLGNVLMYNIHGKLLKSFLLWDSSLTIHILECKLYGNGIVAIASDLTVFTAEVRLSYMIGDISGMH